MVKQSFILNIRLMVLAGLIGVGQVSFVIGAEGIPDRQGQWRIKVVAPGNEYCSKIEKYEDESSEVIKYEAPSSKRKQELEKTLGKHTERFNIEKQIAMLRRNPPSDDGFRFVVMGDSRSNFDLWEDVVEHIDRVRPRPAFIIHTGDVVSRGTAHQYRDYFAKVAERTEIPFFVAIGNHDDNSNHMAHEYRYLFGENALNYFFDYGRVRFVIVDNATRLGHPREILRFLDKSLRETPGGYGKVVCAHQPPAVVDKWAYHAWQMEPSRVFVSLMSKHKADEVFLGHIHAYSTARLGGVGGKPDGR